ncbi:hypothetical protein R83H12_02405 [Fibrobacteria bacterium R8-3-H12]
MLLTKYLKAAESTTPASIPVSAAFARVPASASFCIESDMPCTLPAAPAPSSTICFSAKEPSLSIVTIEAPLLPNMSIAAAALSVPGGKSLNLFASSIKTASDFLRLPSLFVTLMPSCSNDFCADLLPPAASNIVLDNFCMFLSSCSAPTWLSSAACLNPKTLSAVMPRFWDSLAAES